MLSLSNLKAFRGVGKSRKRVGRGVGSGSGKTSGKGQKGQKSRSGSDIHPWFEGGQMPLQRRLPKRGFTNIFKKCFEIVNLSQLARLEVSGPITADVLREKGLVRKSGAVKVLGNGELKSSLEVHAQKFSRSAREKIEKSGGKVVVV
tara:strand:+ start:1133 stop:1573 length:441 start_codon:yes stop_codon:yes gene_type:complete